MIKIKFQVSKTYFQVSWEENLVFLFANFEKKGFYCSCCIAFTTELIEACVNTKYKLLDTASLQITARRGLLGGQRSRIGWRIIQLTKALLAHCERQEGLRLGEGLAFRPLAPINIPQYFMPAPSVDPGVLFSFPLSSPCWFFVLLWFVRIMFTYWNVAFTLITFLTFWGSFIIALSTCLFPWVSYCVSPSLFTNFPSSLADLTECPLFH